MNYNKISVRQQKEITKYDAFNKAIVSRELRNSMQTVVFAFGNNRLVIDVPTFLANQQHMLQQNVFQTVQVGSQSVRVNVPGAIYQLLSGDLGPYRMNENTLMVDATAMIDFVAVNRTQNSWQQKLVECGRSNQEINKFRWVIGKLFPDIDNVGGVLDEVLMNWTKEQLDGLLGKVLTIISNQEQKVLHDICLAFEKLFIADDELLASSFETTQLKFQEYLHKYRPDGWSHYDVDNLADDFGKLFKEEKKEADTSDDEGEFRRQQQKIKSVRRKLVF